MPLHELGFGLVDTHVHMWDPHMNGLDPALASAGSKDVVLRTLDEHGVDRAVVVQPSIHGADHTYLLGAVRESEGRLAGVGLVEPNAPATTTLQLKELCAAPEIVGLRLPIIRADPGWISAAGQEIWQAASANGRVLCAFVGPPEYGSLHPFLEQFPTVAVVIDHIGRLDLAGLDRPECLARLKDLAAFPQVGVKISALGAVALGEFPHQQSWPEVAAILGAFGASRLTWGSDFPSSLRHGSYSNELQASSLAFAGCTSQQQEAIFGSNARRLYWNGR
jgi:predicted TIM-barrel fold metal-dependent hydrolase